MRRFLMLFALGMSGCFVKAEQGKQMQADIIALQTEFEVVRKAHAEEKASLQLRINEADRRLAELNTLVEEHRRSTGRNTADFGIDLDQVKRLVTELSGRVEVSEHRLLVIEKKLNILHEDLSAQRVAAEDRIQREIEEQKKKEALARQKLPDIVRPEKEEEFYKLAYGLLDKGQAKAARILFEEFLKKWPQGDFADNALYWIGESYYAEGDFRNAALTFQRVSREYKSSDKSADALLKIGYCFFSLKMYREALPFLKQFVQTYPKSSHAANVRKKIQEAEKKVK